MPAYSKTTWIDGSAPAIDATNLNKMEQGIYDSLRQDGSTTMSGQLVTTAGSAATPAIAPTGDSNTGIFFPAADTIAFGEGGTEAMRINSSGQVGIGITPDTTFHIGTNATPIKIQASRSDQYGAETYYYSSRGSVASPTATQNNDYIFSLSGFGRGATAWKYTGGIALRAAETFTDSVAGSYLTIDTTPSGTTTSQERMRITSTGNVGIGTTSPSEKLVVDGNISSLYGIHSTTLYNGNLNFYNAGSATKYINVSDDSSTIPAISLDKIGSATKTCFLNGNVGIGTTSPSKQLHVKSGTAEILRLETTVARGSGSNFIQFNDATGSKGFVGYGNTNDVFYLSNDLNESLTLRTNATERVFITGAGNVGIGTTNPSNYSGRASVGVNGTDGGIFECMVGGTVKFQIYPESSVITDSIVLNASGANGYMRFQTYNSEKMRLNNNGYLLIGYTSSNGAYPLQVNGQIFATSSTIATSDGRYKKDIVALDGALDIVKALNPVQFSWKDHPVHKFNTDVPTVGFLAQEVEQALADKSYLTSIIKKSECTWETETGEFVEREVTRDVEKQVTREVEREITETIDGEEVTRTITEEITETIIEQVTEIVTEPVKETHTEEFLGIAESNLIAILTKAVKELTAKVEALEAQLNK